MFASAKKDLKFQMQDGQTVIVGGNINVFERDGSYQLYASEIILDGMGALYEEYERLKMALYEEGLFDHEIKKPIPQNPKKVGIVTAKTGAAIRDIVSVAKRRNPYVQLFLYPAKVQGQGAGASIARGIKVLDAMGLDTIIIGRGGGSIEDLWGFNEEVVARAIFEAETPIISGTGHEIDNTIADYAADLRAATPSAACELAIPDVRTLLQKIDGYEYRLQQLMQQKKKYLDYRLEQYLSRLQIFNPQNQVQQKNMLLEQCRLRLETQMKSIYEDYQHRIFIYAGRLQGLSPLNRLTKGYGYIENKNHMPLRSVKETKTGDEVFITLSDGIISAKVTDTKEHKG